MLFCTLTFFIFLPLVFCIHWLMPTCKWQNVTLLLASCVFYGWWSIPFLLLMLGTCVVNFCLSKAVVWFKESSHKLLWIGVTLDLAFLGVFKYYDFFVTELCKVLSSCGINAHPFSMKVIIPVGVSFYTFQLIGYMVDVYRRRKEGNKDDFLNFMTFITFFPQLVAGPIERRDRLLLQFAFQRHFDFGMARDGMRLILWGLVKKMLVADICAEYVIQVFDNVNTSSVSMLWLGALCFTFQIYGDFSGYSDIAIGCARLFGIRLSRNFCLPYFSQSIRDFWRRWHMTLMSWFKDYVYIPLGGSHCSSSRRRINTLVVFGLSGLWHGANWTYIVWGLYHGIIMCLARKTDSSKRKSLFYRVIGGVDTFLVVMIGWVIFRCKDVIVAFNYICGMFGMNNGCNFIISKKPLLVISILVFVELMMGNERLHPFAWKDSGLLSKQWVRLPIYALVFTVILLLGGETATFIYFQF